MTIYADERTLANVTNGTDETYYYYQEFRDFRYAAIQCILSGGSGTVTCTVEATAEKDTVLASCTWADITSEYFGVASITATGNFVIDTPFPWRALRVKVVASTAGANDADWRINARVTI